MGQQHGMFHNWMCQVGELCSGGGLVPTQFSWDPAHHLRFVVCCNFLLEKGYEAIALPIVLLRHVAPGLGLGVR